MFDTRVPTGSVGQPERRSSKRRDEADAQGAKSYTRVSRFVLAIALATALPTGCFADLEGLTGGADTGGAAGAVGDAGPDGQAGNATGGTSGVSGSGGTSGVGGSDSDASVPGFEIVASLTLDKTTLAPGEKLSSTVTYQNVGSISIFVKTVVITTRPPGGTHPYGPFDDLMPVASPGDVVPGEKVVVIASRDLATNDPLGEWEAYSTWLDANDTWHDGPSLPFTVQ